MRTSVLLLAALAITLLGRIWQPGGLYTQGDPETLEKASEMVGSLPARIGEWTHSGDSTSLHESVVEELGVRSYISRQYENSLTGEAVSVLLMAGEAGPLLRHPPDICYANSVGETLESENLNLSHGPAGTKVRLLTYSGGVKDAAGGGLGFVVGYALTTLGGDAWDAPDYPRITYGAAPALLKAQVLCSGVDTSERLRQRVVDFWEAFASTFPREATAGETIEP